MSGTKAGGAKGRATNLKKDPNYYANIAKKSWKNERSHKTGFALLSREKLIEVSAKGGKKTKDDYKTTLSPEAIKGTCLCGEENEGLSPQEDAEFQAYITDLAKAIKEHPGASE